VMPAWGGGRAPDDRKLYKPKETAHVKGILRQRDESDGRRPTPLPYNIHHPITHRIATRPFPPPPIMSCFDRATTPFLFLSALFLQTFF